MNTTRKQTTHKMPQTIIVDNSLKQVLIKLENIVASAIKNNDRTGYFTALYYKVTAKVIEGIETGQFGDGKNITKLDVQFANRYIFALEQWRLGKPISKSWSIAFEATKKGSYLILQQLLLGMNAHINLDLGIATYEVSNGNLEDFRNDYNYINLILSSLTYGVIRQLDTLSPLISLLGFSGTSSNLMLVQFSLGNARDGSWCFAEELALSKDYESLILQRDNEIAELGESLIKSKGVLKLGLWIIHLFEAKNVADVTTILYDYKKPFKKELKGFKL
jgi:hypothetical protein